MKDAIAFDQCMDIDRIDYDENLALKLNVDREIFSFNKQKHIRYSKENVLLHPQGLCLIFSYSENQANISDYLTDQRIDPGVSIIFANSNCVIRW